MHFCLLIEQPTELNFNKNALVSVAYIVCDARLLDIIFNLIIELVV
jgi:hypothetical protein